MIRHLIATGLAVAVGAGFVGSGAAFAAPTHSAKPVAVAAMGDRSSKDKVSTDQHASNKFSTDKSSQDTSHSTGTSSRHSESAR